MKNHECTCTISMMQDHNAVCRACSEKLMPEKPMMLPKERPALPKRKQAEQCTCDTRMMYDHNAVCRACSQID